MKNFAIYTPTALDTLTSGLLCDCEMQLWFVIFSASRSGFRCYIIPWSGWTSPAVHRCPSVLGPGHTAGLVSFR
jgi:hypothetical protein